jgi:DNA-binding transcriptional ArsR family regulator
MTGEAEQTEILTPDEAFAQLGNETRVEILRILGTAEQPLQFSELYDRTDVEDSGQFNYHLSKLVGQFVTKSEAGYTLSRMGRRVVEAVLSGAVTDTPALDRTEIDEPCGYCGAPIEVGWKEGSVRQFCTECAGQYGRAYSGAASTDAGEGYLGRLPLPPAGVHGRSPPEILHAARIAGNLEVYSLSAGVCPRCSGTIEREISVCENHDAGETLCENCDNLYAVGVRFQCGNCIYKAGGGPGLGVVIHAKLLGFLLEHGYNPVAGDSMTEVNRVHQNYDEEILSIDPLRVELTFHLDGDALSLMLDESLTVIE